VSKSARWSGQYLASSLHIWGHDWRTWRTEFNLLMRGLVCEWSRGFFFTLTDGSRFPVRVLRRLGFGYGTLRLEEADDLPKSISSSCSDNTVSSVSSSDMVTINDCPGFWYMGSKRDFGPKVNPREVSIIVLEVATKMSRA